MKAGLVGLALLSACGPTPGAATAPPAPPPLIAVAGSWAWTSDTTVDGVQRLESEIWSLAHGDDATVTGAVWRRVTLVSTSGVAFTCSQSPRFVLESRTRLEGERTTETAALRETAITRVASPCHDGQAAALETHTARPGPGQLVLSGAGGTQTLERTRATPPRPATVTTAGRWAWETTSVDGGVERREREAWTLTVRGDEIAGRYERTVTLVRPDGAPLGCVAAARNSFTDVYVVSGWVREQARLELVEQSVTPGASPCQLESQRHLDSAHGRLFRDHIELRWRGDRRQVLGRIVRETTPGAM